MLIREKEKLPDLGFLLSAAAAWIASAIVLLILAALTANAIGLGEQGIGYLSSALSFITAAAAGYFAAHRHGSAGFVTALTTATALVISLLTVGFLVKGEEMSPSAILSIVSFTYAGVLLGVFIHPKKKNSGRKRPYRKLT